MEEQRLRWFGARAAKQEHPIKKTIEFEAEGKRSRGAPKKRWDVIKKGIAVANVAAEDAADKGKWRQLTRTAELATEWD
nr:unnamed protein product [Haemonchus contortus]